MTHKAQFCTTAHQIAAKYYEQLITDALNEVPLNEDKLKALADAKNAHVAAATEH